jgi:hypothetical protein
MSHVEGLEIEEHKIITFINFKRLESALNQRGGSQEDVWDKKKKINKGKERTSHCLNAKFSLMDWDMTVLT